MFSKRHKRRLIANHVAKFQKPADCLPISPLGSASLPLSPLGSVSLPTEMDQGDFQSFDGYTEDDSPESEDDDCYPPDIEFDDGGTRIAF